MRRALLVLVVLFAASVDAASIDVVHLVWRTSDDGTPGTRDEWVTRAGQRRELIDHGRDWNGFVAPLEGMDLKRQADFARLHMFGVTGPVDRVDLPSFDGKMNVVMSDFRDAGGGVEVPFTETRTSGPSKSELHLVSVDVLSARADVGDDPVQLRQQPHHDPGDGERRGGRCGGSSTPAPTSRTSTSRASPSCTCSRTARCRRSAAAGSRSAAR